MHNASPVSIAELQQTVAEVVAATPVYDIHTHLFPPAFGDLMLYGIDELLSYHYMIAEGFRYLDMPYEQFWALSKTEQTDLVWDELFIKHSPLSEACRGVITTLNQLGLDVNQRDLPALRQWFAQQEPEAYVDGCMKLAGVKRIGMTNSPFDAQERAFWEDGFAGDPRFMSGLRIDPLLVDWHNTVPLLQADGYEVSHDTDEQSLGEVRDFLADWTKRMNSQYVMVSLPPSFTYPAHDNLTRIIDGAVVPHCIEHDIPFALMIGVKRQVNPNLRLAGDGMGRSDLGALENLLAQYPDCRFLATVLSRENQHELAVLARKFRNLHVFGCWWFVNVPSLIAETTKMRLELIGTSFTAQHSDARVIDQIIYKWDHSRRVIAQVLTEQYAGSIASGWNVTRSDIERDVQELLGASFESFLKPPASESGR